MMALPAGDLVLATSADTQGVRLVVLRYDPGRGVVSDGFPERTVIGDALVGEAMGHPGVVALEGVAGVGGRVRFTCVNGEALYELTERVRTEEGETGWWARRLGMVVTAGPAVVVRTYRDLAEWDWPAYAAFGPAFGARPEVTQAGPTMTVRADGVVGDYVLTMPHPGERGGWVGERVRLVEPGGITVALPTATMRSRVVTLHERRAH